MLQEIRIVGLAVVVIGRHLVCRREGRGCTGVSWRVRDPCSRSPMTRPLGRVTGLSEMLAMQTEWRWPSSRAGGYLQTLARCPWRACWKMQ